LIQEVTGKAGIDSIEKGSQDPFSLSAKYSRTQNLIDLVERNAVLETQIKVLEKTERGMREAWEAEKTARTKAETELAMKADVSHIILCTFMSTGRIVMLLFFSQELVKLVQFSKDFTLKVETERKRIINEKGWGNRF
jgi:hypothetical protein